MIRVSRSGWVLTDGRNSTFLLSRCQQHTRAERRAARHTPGRPVAAA